MATQGIWRFALAANLLFLLAGCGGSEKTAPDPEPIVIEPRRKKPKKKPEPVAVAKQKRRPKPKPLSLEQKLAKLLPIAERHFAKADFVKTIKTLSELLAEAPEDLAARALALQSSGGTALEQSLRLSAKAAVIQALTANLPRDVYAKVGAPIEITTRFGRPFLGYLREDFDGQAEDDEVERIKVVRLDGIETGFKKNDVAYRRIKSGWTKRQVDELKRKEARFDRSLALVRFKFLSLALRLGLIKEAIARVDGVLDCPGSEILVDVYAAVAVEQARALKEDLALLTGDRSRVAPALLAEARAAIAKDKPKRRKPKRAAKPKRVAKPKRDAKPKHGAVEEPTFASKSSDSTWSGDPAKQVAKIKSLYDQGLSRYRMAQNRSREQAELKKTKRLLEQALDAYNILAEHHPKIAEKHEEAMGRISLLLYDCLKRMKLH